MGDPPIVIRRVPVLVAQHKEGLSKAPVERVLAALVVVHGLGLSIDAVEVLALSSYDLLCLAVSLASERDPVALVQRGVPANLLAPSLERRLRVPATAGGVVKGDLRGGRRLRLGARLGRPNEGLQA